MEQEMAELRLKLKRQHQEIQGIITEHMKTANGHVDKAHKKVELLERESLKRSKRDREHAQEQAMRVHDEHLHSEL